MHRKVQLSLFVLGLVAVGLFYAWQVQPVRADGPQTTFTFVVVDQRAMTTERLILNGSGRINGAEVEGDGSFTHFNATGSPPFTVVASGTWKAKSLVSFNLIGTYGAHAAGTLVMDVEVVTASGAVIPATMKMVCNIGAAALSTGQPEGVTVTGVDAPFTPLTGITVFSTGVEEKEGIGIRRPSRTRRLN